ncbi:putative DNA helicase MCM8 [Vitis vinifera]|uniref:Putative DNA helicase MCM8 n=1 Tax=Vitis vinifera TaxID=29760 RepID=A0A438IQ12_VITVI|nr:putative DNA helicase MCM8 [Vitis vinifera]
MYGETMSAKCRFTDTDITKVLATYFPEIQLSANDPRLHVTSQLIHFFSSPSAQQFVSQVKSDDDIFSLSLDFKQFHKICDLEDFYATLDTKPKEALLCMSAAVHKVLSTNWDDNRLEDGVKINIRLHNHPETMIALKNLKSAYIDKLVSVRGTVVKASTVKPLVVQMTFACEILKSENHEEGRVPRTVECELTEDLVDACIPGDVVTVTGIIRQINNYMDIGGV